MAPYNIISWYVQCRSLEICVGKSDRMQGKLGRGAPDIVVTARPLFSVGLLLTSGGLLTIRWFNIMPHLSLFSFCDETLVPVFFTGRE